MRCCAGHGLWRGRGTGSGVVVLRSGRSWLSSEGGSAGICVRRRLQPERCAVPVVHVVGARQVHAAKIHATFLASQHVVEPVVTNPIVAGRKRRPILQEDYYRHLGPCRRGRRVYAAVPVGVERLGHSGRVWRVWIRRIRRRRIVRVIALAIIGIVPNTRRICVAVWRRIAIGRIRSKRIEAERIPSPRVAPARAPTESQAPTKSPAKSETETTETKTTETESAAERGETKTESRTPTETTAETSPTDPAEARTPNKRGPSAGEGACRRGYTSTRTDGIRRSKGMPLAVMSDLRRTSRTTGWRSIGIGSSPGAGRISTRSRSACIARR